MQYTETVSHDTELSIDRQKTDCRDVCAVTSNVLYQRVVCVRMSVFVRYDVALTCR